MRDHKYDRAEQAELAEFERLVRTEHEEWIRRRAYRLYLERGGTFGDGRATEDWLKAEREVEDTPYSRQLRTLGVSIRVSAAGGRA